MLRHQLNAFFLALLCAACVTREEPPAAALSCGMAGGSAPSPLDNAVRSPPPAPDNDTLCDLILDKSTEEDIEAVLGPPSDAWGAHAGGGQISYDFAGNANLTFGFDQNVFYQAMVVNIPYPQCWDDEEQAHLRAEEQPRMDSQP